MPPLRQRRDEIPLLTERFLEQYAEHYNRPRIALSPETVRLFDEYEWPGNVRELENLVKRAVVLGSDESIRQELSEAIAGRRRASGPIPALQPGQTETAAARPATAAAPVLPPKEPVGSDVPVALTGSLKDIGRNAAREAERNLIYRTLQQTRWNRREAAEILGVSYKALLYKIKEADLDKAS
jgi:DNA-binding NtrC family response regulator